MQCTNLSTETLNITDWSLNSDECWAIIGRNGSGKKQLGQLLSGNLEVLKGQFTPPAGRVSILSFESQQAFYENELKIDDTDFMDHLDPGTTVREILNTDTLPELLSFLNLSPLLDRGYRLLSSGESRKVLLAKAFLDQPEFLILDEPYDSLDIQSKADLDNFFAASLQEGKMTLLFLLNTWEEISPWHTHIGVLEQGALIVQGKAKGILANSEIRALLGFNADSLPEWPEDFDRPPVPDLLIELRNGTVRYGDTVIFSGVDLTVQQGCHALITGPNGSGKSTLLSLISGDHSQCYGNDLKVLNFNRGHGETVWEIKKQLGIVSPGLHRDHRVSGNALHIVLSGFFDSIGLYDSPSKQQIEHAKQWLALVGLEDKATTTFRSLSYGEQRLVLIARALVKQPALLLLDEPTQGLDEVNRHRLLYFLEHLSKQKRTTVVMASHRLDEHLSIFTQHIEMENYI